MAIDPVCGMSVDPTTARYASEHAGNTFYFCAPGCQQAFAREPNRFLEKMRVEGLNTELSKAGKREERRKEGVEKGGVGEGENGNEGGKENEGVGGAPVAASKTRREQETAAPDEGRPRSTPKPQPQPKPQTKPQPRPRSQTQPRRPRTPSRRPQAPERRPRAADRRPRTIDSRPRGTDRGAQNAPGRRHPSVRRPQVRSRKPEATAPKPQVPARRVDIGLSGMTCAACASTIEGSLRRVPGVIQANVNLATETATVEYDSTTTGLERLEKAVGDVGYGIRKADPSAAEVQTIELEQAHRSLMRRFVVCATVSGLILAGSMQGTFLASLGLTRELLYPILFVLCLPVMFWGGWQFFSGAIAAARHGSSNMNTLIALGTTTAFVYSTILTFAPHFIPGDQRGGGIYFDTAAVIITLILLGKLLESRARSRTSDALKRLMRLQPQTACLLRNGREVEVPIEEIRVGDRLKTRPGEKVPVDGLILEGTTSIDESMMTGESVPVDKKSGDKVVGGTVNRLGSFIFEATRVGEDTTLAQIVRLVREAQGSKAPVQRLADKIAGRFVPAVILAAVVTFIAGWTWGPSMNFGLLNAVAVLIIACPCAMGLATPTAIMVGTGKGAEAGILIKSGESLETAHHVKTVVLDKTGTLSKGKPQVTHVEALGGLPLKVMLALIASAEASSEHPIGKAVFDYTRRKKVGLLKVTSFRAVGGLGVRARIVGREVLAGSPKFLAEQGIVLSDIEEGIRKRESQGETCILMAVDKKVAGLFGVADTIKEGSSKAVAEMTRLGLDVVMLTGDNEAAARNMAEQVGIKKVLAGVLPDRKAEEIRRLQQEGKRVGMVGDGINDAPALTQADVGIAIGSGTDVAIESSDITLISDDLQGITRAFRLSRATLRVIKQNLFWAFLYNIIGIPLAAGALYPWKGLLLDPMFASAAMAFSSISVVLNSLRLRSVKL